MFAVLVFSVLTIFITIFDFLSLPLTSE